MVVSAYEYEHADENAKDEDGKYTVVRSSLFFLYLVCLFAGGLCLSSFSFLFAVGLRGCESSCLLLYLFGCLLYFFFDLFFDFFLDFFSQFLFFCHFLSLFYIIPRGCRGLCQRCNGTIIYIPAGQGNSSAPQSRQYSEPLGFSMPHSGHTVISLSSTASVTFTRTP